MTWATLCEHVGQAWSAGRSGGTAGRPADAAVEPLRAVIFDLDGRSPTSSATGSGWPSTPRSPRTDWTSAGRSRSTAGCCASPTSGSGSRRPCASGVSAGSVRRSPRRVYRTKNDVFDEVRPRRRRDAAVGPGRPGEQPVLRGCPVAVVSTGSPDWVEPAGAATDRRRHRRDRGDPRRPGTRPRARPAWRCAVGARARAGERPGGGGHADGLRAARAAKLATLGRHHRYTVGADFSGAVEVRADYDGLLRPPVCRAAAPAVARTVGRLARRPVSCRAASR